MLELADIDFKTTCKYVQRFKGKDDKMSEEMGNLSRKGKMCFVIYKT